jgi:TPR repeat protein
VWAGFGFWEGLPHCALARLIHSSNKYWNMRMGIFRVPIYFLCIFALNQAHYASEGRRWLDASLKDVQAAAEVNDSYAQGFLALVYAHGDKGSDISIMNASKWAALSSQANHWLGHFALGYLARFRADGLDGDDVGRYYLKSFRDPDGRMIKAAASGDPIASYALAEIFTSDEVRPSLVPDLELAAEHYSVSSHAGYAPASVEFALLKAHAVGNDEFGIKKDLAGGIALLQEAARTNLPSANHYLGRFYFKGIGVKVDPRMALVHYQAAADRGHAISQLTVADFHAYGEAGPVKVDLALRYARLALDQMETQALEKIAAYEELLAGGGTAPPGQPSTLPQVPSPAESSPPPPPPPSPARSEPFPPAQASLSPALPSPYEGSVRIPEPSSSVYPPQPSTLPIPPSLPPSVSPSPSAGPVQKRELAKKHYFGREALLDYERSIRLFTESANAGDAEAARYLGIMYLRGKGVLKDNAKAFQWFTLASDRGDPLAKKNAKMLQSLIGN